MSSNANFVRGPDGKTVKKTVLPSATPSVGNVTVVGKVQIDLNNIVVGGETLSIEPKSITFLNSTPGIAEANKAIVLDGGSNIEQLNIVGTDELYVGGNQVTGLVNKGATVSNSIYMNDIQPGIGREGKIVSSNDDGEVENAYISADIVEYNGGVVESQSNEIFNDPISASATPHEKYSHLKMKEIRNFYVLGTANAVTYDSFRDIHLSTTIGQTSVTICESIFKSGGGSFSTTFDYAATTTLSFSKENIAYSPVLDKYLIPVTTGTQYSIRLSPSGHPSSWTNASVWTTVVVCSFTNNNNLTPYVKWSSILNKFLTAAGGKVYQSETGETWSELYTLSNSTYTRTIICHEEYVMIVNPGDTLILYTTDGITWSTKTFTSAFSTNTTLIVQYVPETDCIFTGPNKIRASAFLARPATGNTFDSMYPSFTFSSARYPIRYIKDSMTQKEFLLYQPTESNISYLYRVYSLETNTYTCPNLPGHWFDGQIILFSYMVTAPFTSTRAFVYDFSTESLYRGMDNISADTAKRNVVVEPEVFLNFEVATRVIVRDFQWVPDIKKYIAIGFANEAYSTSEYANVCLYHSDDLITFKFIRDLGRPGTNKIVVEETTGYVYGIEIGVNHLIILSEYGSSLISSATTIGAITHAVYDRYNSFGVIMSAGGPAALSCGRVIQQSNIVNFGIGYISYAASQIFFTNNSLYSSGSFNSLLTGFVTVSGSGNITNATALSHYSTIRNFSKGGFSILQYTNTAITSYSVPVFVEHIGIYVRLRYNFNNDTTFKISYTHQSDLSNETNPLWIDVPLQAPFFSYNSIWVPSIRYDANSGRLYVVGNSDLQRTIISLNNLSLEETPFMRNHLSAHYARDDSGNELYPLQTIYTPAINFNAITYSCGVYVATGPNTIFVGNKLSTATSSTLSGNWKGIASSLTHFIVAGYGKIAVSTNAQPLSFQTNSTFPLVENWNYIHYSTQLDMWAVCADGKWAFSTNTTTWTAVAVAGNWKSIKYSNGYWIAVGLNNVGYMKMVTPTAPSAATVAEVVGDWKDCDFGGRWIITGFGKTAFSSGLNKPDGWTAFASANGKNYNTATWVEGLSHFFLAGEHYSTFISNGNKLYHAPAQLISEVSGKVCKFAMWSERYKGVIMVGDGCITGTRMLGSGLDNSMIINSSIISSSNNPYNFTSFLKVSDYSESNFVVDGYLSAVTNVMNKEILSIKNNSTQETVVVKQDTNLMTNLSVPKELAIEATILKINDVRMSDELDLEGLGIAAEGVASEGNYLSLDSNGSVSNFTQVNCGGLIVGDEIYSNSTPSQLTEVTSGIVSAGKAVKLDSNVSVVGVNELASNGITFKGQEFVGESADESLVKWSVGNNSSMDGGNFNITDTCYSTTLDLFIAVTSFNNNTNMNAEREKNFILVSKNGVNWRKVYTGLAAGLMYVIPVEKMPSAVRTGVYFVASATGNFTNSYIVYTSDCVNFFWMDGQDYPGGINMNMGYGAKMIVNDSIVDSPVVFKDPTVSALGVYLMYANSGGSSASLKIGNVKNAIAVSGAQYYALAGNVAVNASGQVDMTPNSASIGTGTINNCIFIQGLSGAGVDWDVVYVADSGRVLFKTASEATLALTTMQPNTTLVVDTASNFTCITYNPVSRRMLITATNGKIYISDAGSKSIWTQVTVPNASVLNMEWTRVRCAYEKGFLLIHANDTDSKCNSKVCRVTNEGVFIETYTNIKRQLRLGAYGKGMYVVPILNEYSLGYKIMYSTDGINWKYSLMQIRGVYRVIYVANLDKFFACYDKYIASSTDAVTWTTIFTHPVNGVVCMELDYAENKNTLLGIFGGTATQQLAYSTDTTNWSTSTIISNDNTNYQFMKYCDQLSRLIVCTYESNGTAAMYSDDFTTFTPCVSIDSEASNKPRGRNIMWVKEGSFLTMGNLWDGQWSSPDGISWTRNKVFKEYGSNGAYSFGTFNIVNTIYVPNYGDIIVHSNGSKGNNFVRISKGAYKVIAPAESNSVEWAYSMLMYNSNKNQIVAYKYSEGTRKGDTFLIFELEDFRNNKTEIPVDYLSKISNDKEKMSSYLSTNNIVTLANSTLDGGALNTVALNNSIFNLSVATSSLDSTVCNNIFWINELERFFILSNAGILTSKDGENWSYVLNNFNATSLCYSPSLNMFVAVRNNNSSGCIATSVGGVEWTIKNASNNTIAWNKVIWASSFNMFIACSGTIAAPAAGDLSKIMTSIDGINWTAVDTGPSNRYRGHISMDYSPFYNNVVGITDANTISFYSLDGVNWVYPTVTSSAYATKDVLWVPSIKQFICLYGQTSQAQLMVTTDGITMTNYYYTTNQISSILYSSDIENFITLFQQGSSYGYRWQDNTAAEAFGSSAFMSGLARGTWCGKFSSYFFVHTSGTDRVKRMVDSKAVYSYKPNPINGTVWKNVCWSPYLSLFVAVAESGNARIMISPNGNQWSNVNYYNQGMSLSGVCWSPELAIFVAVSKSGIKKVITSVDGINWIERGTPGSAITGGQWTSVCWSAELSLFVAVASAGTDRIITSTNGIDWSVPASVTGNTSINNSIFNSVCWSSDLSLFVAAGNSPFAKSNDGVNWFVSTVNNISAQSICWSPILKMFAAVGTGGNKLITSIGGEVWTARSTFISTINPYSIAWASSKFVVCGTQASGYGFVAESKDGVMWEQSYSTTSAYSFKSIAYSPSLNEYAVIADTGADRILNITNASTSTLITSPFTSLDYKLSLNVTESTPAPSSVNWTDVVYAPAFSAYCSVANTGTAAQKACTSTDAITWTNRNLSTDGLWSSICYGEFASSWKVVAGNGGTGTYGFLIASSASNWNVSGSGITHVSSVCASEELKMYVAVRSTGANRVVTSAGDATNWILSASADENSSWSSVCWSPSLRLFIGLATTGANRLMTSANGTTWTLGTLSDGLENCSWVNACWSERLRMFLAISSSGDHKMMKSVNGTTWTQVASSSFTSSLKKIIWCSGRGVFLGLLSTGNERLLYSYDGVNWIVFSSIHNAMDWSSICWNPATSTAIATSNISPTNSKFMNIDISPSPVASIRSMTSVDEPASAWQSIACSQSLSLYVSVASAGTNRVMTSTDAITWSAPVVPAEVNTTTWSSVCWSPSLSLFVAVASAGTNRVMTSADGITWEVVASAVAGLFAWRSVCWSPSLSLFVAVANGGTGNRVMTSVNGTEWTGASASSNTNGWLNVCWSPVISRFVAVADSGTGRIMWSSDGTTWTAATMPSTTDSNTWKCVCWADGLNQFTAVAETGTGATKVITSRNGANWDLSLSTSYINFSYVTWAPSISLFVGIGPSSTYRLMTSKDGYTWKYNTSSNNLNEWSSILWNSVSEKFVAVARLGTNRVMNILVDRNNITMSYPTYTPPADFSITYPTKTDITPSFVNASGYSASDNSLNIRRICFSEELCLFVAVALSGTNRVMTSKNGMNWTGRASAGESNSWSGVCWSPELSLFVVVASAGTNRVMTSPDGITWTARTSAGESNSWFSVCWSPELNLFVAISYTGTNRVMTSSDGITWTARTSAGESNSWHSICWSSQLNLFVAVAGNGTNRVMTSPDGITWAARISAMETNTWMSLCWSPELSLFVAVASAGTNRVMTSPDGITWTVRTSAVESNSWHEVCWSPELNLFAAVSYTGTNRVMTSSDGITWTAMASSTETNGWLTICWSKKLNIFCCSSYSGTDIVMNLNPYIPLTLTNTTGVAGNFNSICWSPELSLFVAVNSTGSQNAETSTDGTGWTVRETPPQGTSWRAVCWSPELSLFAAVGDAGTNRVMTSPDGIIWTIRSASDNAASWRDVCWSSQLSLFVAVASDSGTGRVMTSADGISWTTRTSSNNSNYWYSVCWSPELSLFVAVAISGTNRVMTSPDGITWAARTSAGESNSWYKVCWSPVRRMFVAISYTGTNRVMYSYNGITWNARASAVEANAWYGICWSDSLKCFISTSISGTNRVMASSEGINWYTYLSPPDTSAWYGICDAPSLNKCVAVSQNSTIMNITKTPSSNTYPTAISSVARPTPPATAANIWRSVCWSKDLGIFVALSTQGNNRVATSVDGLNWILRPNIAMDVGTWYDVCWSSKLKIFVAVGGSGTRRVGISFDGIRWETVLSGNESNSWNSVCWSLELNLFVAVASTGTNKVMISANGIDWVNIASAIESNVWVNVCWSPELKMFIAISSGGAMYSRNGHYWVASGTLAISNAWVSIDWSPVLSLFVAVALTGTNRFAYSSNGTSWTTIPSPLEVAAWTTVIWLPEVKSFIALSTGGHVAESRDGIMWQITQTQTGNIINATWSPLLKKLVSGVNDVSANFLVLNMINSPVVTEQASTSYQELGTVVTKLSPGTGQSIPARPTDVVYSSSLNIYTAVCDQGTFKLLYSYNGADWFFETQSSSTLNSSSWYRVCWNASWSMFVAVASSGTDRIAVSTNGKTWTAISSEGFSKAWVSIVSRETNVDAGVTAMVIALSTAGDVLRSVDGVDWTVTASGNTNSWYSVVWNQTLSKFTAVSNSTTNRIMNSTDGLTWTSTTFNLANARGIVWSPSLSLYVAVSQTASANSIYTSVDGITWTARTLVDTANFVLSTTFTSFCVEWIQDLGMFIVPCASSSYSNYALLSKDGINWFPRMIMPDPSSAALVCKWNLDKQELLCVKQTSIDYGVLITKLGSMPTLSLSYRVKWDLLWVKGIQMFVAMKKINSMSNFTQFYLSTDGKSWSADITNFGSHIATDFMRAVTSYAEIPQWDMLITCKNSNYLQTISQNGVQQLNIGNPVNCVYYSSVLKCLIAGINNSNTIGLINLFRDGTLGNSIFNPLPVNLIIKEICICNGNHIIIPTGTTSSSYYYSYDMAKFELSTLPSADEWHFASRKVRGYETEVVAVSAGGIIIRSVDGISWTTIKNYNLLESAGSRKFSNIKYIEELEVWVAVDEAKKINPCIYSSDSINWIDVNMPSAVSLCDVAFSSSIDGFVFLTLPDDASQPVTTLATLPKLATCYNSMKVDGFNISSNGGIYTGNSVSNTFLSNTLETMPLLALATDSAYKPSTSTWTINSDRRLKEEIENMDIDECLNMLERLELKYYKWRDEFADAVGVEDKHKLGFIAQEVEEVVPDAIYNLGDIHGVQNAKSVNYDQLIAILYGAIQALMSRYEKLKTELES